MTAPAHLLGGVQPPGAWGFGAAGIGSLAREVDEPTARATVDAAWDAGVRLFDTAPHYGLGLSETRLGDALAHRARADFTLSTKVGRLLVPTTDEQDDLEVGGFAVRSRLRRRWDFSATGVRASLADSMRRLRVDRIDVAFLHDPEEHDLTEGLGTALPTLVRIRDEGMLGAVGVGSKSVAALVAAVRTGLVDVVMVAGRYTLLDSTAADLLLPLCTEQGVQVLAVGVFNSGALGRDVPDPGLPYEYGAMAPEVFERVQRIAAVCHRFEVALPVAALAFPRRHPAVTGIVVGAQGPEQVAENTERLTRAVPEECWGALRDEGLV